MRTEDISPTCFRVFDAPALDPITVVIIDYGGGCGHLIVECYGRAWAAYWGAMGSHNVAGFVTDCDSGYVANCLIRGTRPLKRDEAYLVRIVEIVQRVLRDKKGS